MPELGLARENIVFVSGHRLLVALPVLHGHLRDALDPRPRAGDRDRPGGLAPRPVGVGRHRRRRRAVHRRQPPDPRAAPQREPEDPAVQQPDLRPDQGPVLPHLRARQDHQVDADGLAGLAVQPGLARAGRRGVVRRPHDRLRPQAPDLGAARPRPSTTARRWSRSTRTATSSTTTRSSRSRTRATRDDFTIRLEHGQPITWGAERRARRRARPRQAAQGRRDRRRRPGRARRARRARRRTRRTPSTCRGWPTSRWPAPRSASSATSTGRSTTT